MGVRRRGQEGLAPCLSFSFKWASVSRFLYFDVMYTMHENVASCKYVDPNWPKAFVASFFKHAYFFGAFNQKLDKSKSLNWIFLFFICMQLCHLQSHVTTSLNINPKWKLNMSIHLFQFRKAFFEICLQNRQVLNEVLLYTWKYHLTIRFARYFL